ncbi:hypothetical protein KMI_19g20000 [Encephalitozoon hellem]|nr:hypothetical protein KMI_19g20000 [Encephalitozoon hellem]
MSKAFSFYCRIQDQAFLDGDRGLKLSERKRDLFEGITDTIDRIDTISWYCVQTPDVAAKEELLSKTLSDIFPTLQARLDCIIEGVSSSSDRLRQNVGDMQGDGGSRVKGEVVKVFGDIWRKGEFLQDGVDEGLCDYGCGGLGFSDLSHQAHSSGIVSGVIQKIMGLEIGGIVIGLVIVLLVDCVARLVSRGEGVEDKG